MRILLVRVIKMIILIMAFLIALDKFGFSVAPWKLVRRRAAPPFRSTTQMFWA